MGYFWSEVFSSFNVPTANALMMKHTPMTFWIISLMDSYCPVSGATCSWISSLPAVLYGIVFGYKLYFVADLFFVKTGKDRSLRNDNKDTMTKKAWQGREDGKGKDQGKERRRGKRTEENRKERHHHCWSNSFESMI